MRKTILVDLDHTLSNSFWRDPMIGTTTWDEYHAANVEDKPVHDVAALINALWSAGHTIIGITARPGKWRAQSLSWLIRHNIHLDELLMRPDDDFKPAPQMKIALAIARFGNAKRMADEVAAIIDDREDVIMAFKEVGITALQVHARRD